MQNINPQKFDTLLGVNTIVGRAFTADDAGATTLLGYSLWQRRFGGDPQVVGKTIELDKQAFTQLTEQVRPAIYVPCDWKKTVVCRV